MVCLQGSPGSAEQREIGPAEWMKSQEVNEAQRENSSSTLFLQAKTESALECRRAVRF